MKNIGFVSLGCAKNLTDTETMLGVLTDSGFAITADPSDAQVLVVNTCAFIDSAKEESINAILEMAQYKQHGKCELLIVTGCLAQRYKSEIEQQLCEVDIILGTSDYDKIANVITEYYNSGSKNSYVGSADRDVPENLTRVRSTPKYSAYLKIADGCDNRCTYCIIPKLRGKYRSRSEQSIIAEAKALALDGVKELILVAQDTAYYGKDKGGYKLAHLLNRLGKIDGIEWIRLQYCYPENITDDLIDEIASNAKVVKYIDMPLQHISDNVLKKMGRKSRKAQIEQLIDKLRSKIDDVVIRTSLIVGFPGETDDDFEQLMQFAKKYELDKVGVFAYSKEEGTPAYNYANQVEPDVAQARLDAIMSQQKQISAKINEAKIGKNINVIAEGYDESEFCYIGRTSTDTPEVDGIAYIYSDRQLNAGDIVTACVICVDEYDVVTKVI